VSSTSRKKREFEISIGGAALLFLSAVLFAANGCARRDATEAEAEPPEPPIETRPLEVGESVVFEFEANGDWIPSPYEAYHGHELRFRPVGAGLRYNPSALQFRIGRLYQIIGTQNEIIVTEPGPIAFRANVFQYPEVKGTLEVAIDRMK
jgi:hypothetical protein